MIPSTHHGVTDTPIGYTPQTIHGHLPSSATLPTGNVMYVGAIPNNAKYLY
jgi:hypothetical protein